MRDSTRNRGRRRALTLLGLLAAGWLAGPAALAAPLEDSASLLEHVLALSDERLALMPAIAAAKWHARQSVADPAREGVVIAAAADRAAATGLARAPVAALLEIQIGLARELQESLHARWRTDGYDGPDPAPSLAGDLRPRLDALSATLIEALYLAAPSLAERGAATRLATLATRVLPAARWTPAARAALVDALASVRLEQARSVARARSAGVLRVGTPADYAPFSVREDRSVEGSDVALAVEFSTATGFRAVFVQTSWGGLLDDLAADRFDIAVGGISVTAARRAVAAFSLPIARSGKTALGRCVDRARYATLDAIDHRGVRVVENPGGTNEAFARRALHAATLLVHADNLTVLDELLATHADVMFTDETEVTLAARRHPALCRLLATAYEPADKAFLLPREAEWNELVNGWLAPQIAHGAPAAALARYLAR